MELKLFQFFSVGTCSSIQAEMFSAWGQDLPGDKTICEPDHTPILDMVYMCIDCYVLLGVQFREAENAWSFVY